jgi:hypothetical protein
MKPFHARLIEYNDDGKYTRKAIFVRCWLWQENGKLGIDVELPDKRVSRHTVVRIPMKMIETRLLNLHRDEGRRKEEDG